MTDPNLECTETEMRYWENLMHDYAWSGEEKAYQRARKRFKEYYDLYMAGVLCLPKL